MIAVVRGLTGKVRRLSIVSAFSGGIAWWIWFSPHTWLNGLPGKWGVFAMIVLILLLIPAGAAYVGYRMLNSILDLPSKLKETASDTTSGAVDALTTTDASRKTRVFVFFQTIWAARSLVLDSQEIWGKALAAAKVARLASLPFVLVLLATFALNFLVIGLAAISVLWAAIV